MSWRTTFAVIGVLLIVAGAYVFVSLKSPSLGVVIVAAGIILVGIANWGVPREPAFSKEEASAYLKGRAEEMGRIDARRESRWRR